MKEKRQQGVFRDQKGEIDGVSNGGAGLDDVQVFRAE